MNTEQDSLDPNPVTENIKDYILSENVSFIELEHDHVHSSADAARTRGTKLEEAAKALVLQAKKKKGEGEDFLFMCIVSGHKTLDMKKVKAVVGCKNVCLADPKDVYVKTGCVIGTVSPMPKLFELRGFCDSAVLENDHVVFSCASHFKSLRMKSVDWLSVSGADVMDLSKA